MPHIGKVYGISVSFVTNVTKMSPKRTWKMKINFNNRGYLTRWYNIPALLLTAFMFLTVAESIAARREQKAVKKWRAGLNERVEKY